MANSSDRSLAFYDVPVAWARICDSWLVILVELADAMGQIHWWG